MFGEEELKLFSEATGFRQDEIIKIQDNLLQDSHRFKRVRDLKPGDSFEKQYLLGYGGQAFVFQGENIHTNLEVAIKISRSNKKIYQDICKELNAIEKIVNHDYIVKVFKHFMLEKELIIVLIMEKCKYSLDKEVNEMIKKGQEYSQDQIKFIILSMINALFEIHSNDIIHFDIKPSNILITQEGNYKLADFGYAKSLGYGTINYNSPEQYETRLNQDQQKQHKLKSSTDIYSMGVSLLEVIGIKMDYQIILGLKGNNFKKIDTKVKCNYINYYSFIKYFMLQFNQEKRYSAVRLRNKFIEIYKNELTWKIEEDRINKQITEYLVNSANKNSKYLTYLYYFLSKIQTNNETNLIQQSIQIIKELSLSGSFDEAIFLEHYSELLFKSNLYEESLKYLLQSESIIQKKYPDNHLEKVLITLNCLNIGNKYETTLKNVQIIHLMLKINLKIILNLSILIQLCISYDRLGDANKGLEYHLKALKMREALYKGDHPDIASSLNNLGVSYDRLGDANKGLEYHLKALKMREALYKGDYPDIAQSLNNLGVSYDRLGDANKGLEYYLKALKMREALYKGDHPDIAQSLNSLGATYDRLGDANKGLEYYLKALKMREALYNGDHPDIADSLNSLGVTYCRLGDANKGLEYMLKALKMREALYKGDHPDIADSLNSLGVSNDNLGDANKGLEYHLKALKMREALYKGDHPDIVQSLNNIAYSYQILGNNIKSKQYRQRGFEMKNKLKQ